MVVPEVVETRAAIKFCVNLGHTPTKIILFIKNSRRRTSNEEINSVQVARTL